MVPTLNIFFQSCTLNDFYQECMIEKKYWILPLVVFTLIFFFNHPLLVKNNLKLFFSICWIIFKINECESGMAVKKYWKILLVVMVSLEKYWIYHSWPSATRDKFNIFSRDYHNFLTKRPGVYAYPEPTSLAPLYICVWLHYISI